MSRKVHNREYLYDQVISTVDAFLLNRFLLKTYKRTFIRNTRKGRENYGTTHSQIMQKH